VSELPEQGIPLFPLGTVLFPGVVLPLHVFEPRYRELIRHLMAQPSGPKREFGVVALRRGWEVGDTDTDALYDVGCTAELKQVKTYDDGRFDIITVGRRRFRLRGVTDPGQTPYLRGEVDWLPEQLGPPGEAEELVPRVIAAFRRYLDLLANANGNAEPVVEQLPEDPTVLSHLVAATASLTVADRQHLLAAPDVATRLRSELTLLNREASLLAELRAVPVPLVEFRVPMSPN